MLCMIIGKDAKVSEAGVSLSKSCESVYRTTSGGRRRTSYSSWCLCILLVQNHLAIGLFIPAYPVDQCPSLPDIFAPFW